MNVLILGDSWAADWSEQHSEYLGWPNIVAEQHTVTNIAQAGVSQYSICKQLQHYPGVDHDAVIISITSPYRIYTPQHPVHQTGLHVNSDLIYTDIEYHATENPDNIRLQSAKQFYEHHFDTEHAEFVHQQMVDWCINRIELTQFKGPVIVTSNIENNQQYVKDMPYTDGHAVYQSYPGKINHLSAEGNEIFADTILGQL